LLESVGALPFKDLVTYDLDNTIRIGGKKLTVEQTKLLKEGATQLEKNWAYQIIKEQVAYEAIKYGVHSSLTVDMLSLSKAALWLNQQEIKLIKDLSGTED
jgi:hypothetical protein